MSKPTVSAAGGAMPAEGHKTRRAALRLFAGAPALATFPSCRNRGNFGQRRRGLVRAKDRHGRANGGG
jgi:hypothetical protein